MNKTTAIVILNYNNYTDTINCINSVLKYNTSPVKFYVVDNGSPDNNCVPELNKYFKETFSDSYLRITDKEDVKNNSFPRLTFITSEVNDGYARGNNKALKYTKNDKDIEYILILNNDVLFVEDIIPGLIQKLNSLQDAAIVSPLLLKRDGKTLDFNCARLNVSMGDLIMQNLRIAFRLGWKSNDKFYLLKTNPDKIHEESVEIELPSGSCMLVKKELFFQIGCFDPHTFLYYEENILYKKLQRIEKRNYLIPKLRCIHLGAQSTKKQKKNYKQFAMSSKSMRYYVYKYSDSSPLLKLLFDFSFMLSHLSKYLSSNIKKLIKN